MTKQYLNAVVLTEKLLQCIYLSLMPVSANVD